MGRNPSHLKVVAAAASSSSISSSAPTDVCGRPKKSGGMCTRRAGWGTGTGGGPCRDHAGSELAPSSCPLPLTKLQRQLWDDFLPRLEELGLDRGIFWPNLYGLVVALADLQLHSELAASALEPVKGDNGTPKKHPSATIVNQRLGHVRSFMDSLGLSAAALTRAPRASDTRSTMAKLLGG